LALFLAVTDRIIQRLAIKRLGRPEDIANAALFLASDESTWVTEAKFNRWRGNGQLRRKSTYQSGEATRAIHHQQITIETAITNNDLGS
jgi:hypothetical protein